MRKIWIGFLTAGALSSGLVGCQDKVADENHRLWQQNRELTEQVDEALRDLAAADPARPADSRLRKRLGADFLVTGACLPGFTSRCDAVLHDLLSRRTVPVSAVGARAQHPRPT